MSKEKEFESSVTALGEDKCPRPQALPSPPSGFCVPRQAICTREAQSLPCDLWTIEGKLHLDPDGGSRGWAWSTDFASTQVDTRTVRVTSLGG